jgi:hypothetical protein
MEIMRSNVFVVLLMGVMTFGVSQAQAGAIKGVVELFTSQGCSSCPPADRAFSGISKQNGVIGIAWHVDYWDYLGWRDTFSSAQATSRQQNYAAGVGGSSYTPQIIVNGKRVVGQASSSTAIASALQGSLPVALDIKRSGSRIIVEAGGGTGNANLVLVRFYRDKSVKIKRGENAGATVTYHHPVINARNIGTWKGQAMRQNLPVGECGGSAGCAILLQRGGAGEILGAAML